MLTEQSIVVGGRRLRFWHSAGDATTPLLVLHGLGADHEGLTPLAARLAGFETIAVDLPGFGRSEPMTGPHTPDSYAAVIEALCDELDLHDIAVLGHSLGATIALTHAARFPARVRALMLLMPVTAGTGPSTWPTRAYYRVGALLPERLARLWFLSRAAVFVSDQLTLVSTDKHLRRAVREQDYRTAMMASPRAIQEIYRGIQSAPLLALAGHVRADTLILGAERDSLAPRQSLVRLRQRVPTSDLVIVPGAGHLWPVEAPDAAAALISRLLRRAYR
jgi:pimeloyl-ACP methyl ester carboxylesterase